MAAVGGSRSALLAAWLVACLCPGAATLRGQAYEVLFAFPSGFGAPQGLTLGADGRLYASSTFGGSQGAGAIVALEFQAAGDVSLRTIHAFQPGEGSSPIGELAQDGSGNFYGATISGGASGFGTIFRLDPSGTLTTLYSFDGTTGSYPFGVIRDAAGNLHGTAGGAAQSLGILFTLAPTGGLTVLHEFSSIEGSLGAPPALAADGSLWVTAFRPVGPTNPNTTGIFRVDSLGTFAPVTSFTSETGTAPRGALIQAEDGSFYATASGGGAVPAASGHGTIFQVSAGGAANAIHRFDGTDGAAPWSRLLQGQDGDLYGTTSAAGDFNLGTVFRTDTLGTLTTLHHFAGIDGGAPRDGLVQGSGGVLYGVTSGGGPDGAGVLYRLVPCAPSPCAEALHAVRPTSGLAAGPVALTLLGGSFQPGAAITIAGIPAANADVGGSAFATADSPPLAPGTLNDVSLANPGSSTPALLRGGFFADFTDVPQASPGHGFVEKLVRGGLSAGCGGGRFCPEDPVSRAQSAVFLLRAEHGASYLPPPATGVLFADVPAGAFAGAWIERLYAEGVTGGCGTAPLRYCPDAPVTRAQMAVLLLRTEHGPGYVPPPATGAVFADVPANGFAAAWIEQLYAEGVTGGCGASPRAYCPDVSVTRGQMAVFLAATFGL